jgi:hypothetical protein|tara:strand:+ start:334 stop:540 length:207 start_codon:yes stop_codon:yes gene_type:complete
MLKRIKQEKKRKVFKNGYKSIHNPCFEEINGSQDRKISEYNAEYYDKGIPKKKLPKDSMVFGNIPSKR